MDSESKWEPLKRAGQLSSLGIAMVLSIVIGVIIGIYLDKLLGTKPWMFLLFMIFGIIAGFRIVFKEVARLGEEDSDERPGGGSSSSGPGDQY